MLVSFALKRVWLMLSLAGLSLALSACAGHKFDEPLTAAAGTQPAVSPRSSQPPEHGPNSSSPNLPALADLEDLGGLPSRQVDTAGTVFLPGGHYFRANNHVEYNYDTANVSLAPTERAWAIYSFLMDSRSQETAFHCELSGRSEGMKVWIALSNFTTLRWQFFGPFDSDSISIELNEPVGTWTNCYTYAAVLCDEPGSCVLESMSFDRVVPDFPGWSHSFGSFSTQDNLADWLVGADGNIYVCGDYTMDSPDERYRACLLKYDATGNLLKSLTYGISDPLISDEETQALQLLEAPGGDLFVALTHGYYATQNQRDIILLRVNSDLELQWQKRWETNGVENCNRLQFDEAGNLLLLGNSAAVISGLEGPHGLVLKFDPDGNLLLSQVLNSPPANHSESLGSATFNLVDGDTYYSASSSEFGKSSLLIKVNALNQVLWMYQCQPDGTTTNHVHMAGGFSRIYVDADGNLLFSGNVSESMEGNPRDTTVLFKYSTLPEELAQYRVAFDTPGVFWGHLDSRAADGTLSFSGNLQDYDLCHKPYAMTSFDAGLQAQTDYLFGWDAIHERLGTGFVSAGSNLTLIPFEATYSSGQRSSLIPSNEKLKLIQVFRGFVDATGQVVDAGGELAPVIGELDSEELDDRDLTITYFEPPQP